MCALPGYHGLARQRIARACGVRWFAGVWCQQDKLWAWTSETTKLKSFTFMACCVCLWETPSVPVSGRKMNIKCRWTVCHTCLCEEEMMSGVVIMNNHTSHSWSYPSATLLTQIHSPRVCDYTIVAIFVFRMLTSRSIRPWLIKGDPLAYRRLVMSWKNV